MATVLDELVSKIRLTYEGGAAMRRSKTDIKGIADEAKKTSSVLSGMRRAMVEAWGARTALNGLRDVARFVVDTNVAFQRLQASLKTVTGSASAADAAFGAIKKFARETPFSVQEVTTAFVRLKSLGLDSSEEAMRSFGNTASALGKNILDFIEAVADASTGEFERLKEFGIKASTQGDNVAFTFQGQTTVVRKNASAITEYLKAIGNTKFAGAMDEQMKTLGGAFANLQDAVEQFAVDIGEGGLNDALREIALDLSDMTGGGKSLAQVIGGALGKAMRDLWASTKRLLPTFGELLKHIPDAIELMGGLAKIAITLLDLFARFAKSVGGVDTAIKMLLPALAAMKVATIAAAGPWGALAAAMLAAIPIAMEAGEAIGNALANAVHDLDKLDRLNGGRTKKRGTEVFKLNEGDAGFEIARSKIAEMSDEEVTELAYGPADGSLSPDVISAVFDEKAKRDAASRQRAGEVGETKYMLDTTMKAHAESLDVSKRAIFANLMRKKRRGKMTPSEKKMLTALSKDLNLSTDKGHKAKKEKEHHSAGYEEVKDRVDELVKAEELRAFHRAGGTTAERERAAKTAGEFRRSQLMAEVDRGNLGVLGGNFTRERMMMRDAGLIDEAMNTAPPVLTVNITRYDVKVDAPISVDVANASASGSDIAAQVRTAVREVFRGEVRTAIETVRPLQRV